LFATLRRNTRISGLPFAAHPVCQPAHGSSPPDHIVEKLNLHPKAELIKYAIQKGLIETDA
jgi:hypothetical protein